MTKTEIELGMTLAGRIYLLTAAQAERHGWKATLDRLVCWDIVRMTQLVFAPLVPHEQPLWVHRPGDMFSYEIARAILDQAKQRQQLTAPRSIVTYQATKKAYALWGDAARKHGNPFTLGHDHILTELFCRLHPGERAHWRNELTATPKPALFEKVPDVAIVDGCGALVRYHEAVSASYSIGRLIALAEHGDQMLGIRRNYHSTGIYFW